MATMQDVAKRANVSLSTVSYALSGMRPVSTATKARIDVAMNELGFRPNAFARGLASRRSRTVALIFPTMEVGLSGTMTEFVTGAAHTARENGYHLVLWPFDTEHACELLQQGMADGVLLMEVCLQDARVDAFRAIGANFTMIGRTENLEGLTYVDIDFEQTVEDAVAYLTGLGHRLIGFLNHSAASQAVGYGPTVRAAAAFTEAMRRRGLEPRALLCDESPAAGRDAVTEYFACEPGMTALVSMNEVATFGVIAEIRDRGLRIPEDFSVLSIVTSPGVAAMSSPSLTTMHAPGEQLGRLGVHALLGLIGGSSGAPQPALITCGLVLGDSTGPAPPDRPGTQPASLTRGHP